MLLHSVLLGILAIFAKDAFAKTAPDFIHPCNATTKECLVKATQDAVPEFVKGFPELNVPSIDPFVIDELAIPMNGFKLIIYRGEVTGLGHCVVDNVISELDKRYFEIQLHSNVTLKGQYKAVGNILIFPIDGEGDLKIRLTNIRLKIAFKTKYTKDQKGVNHFAIRNYNHTYDFGDDMKIYMQNIFKGNKEFSATILKFLNENWRTVAEDIGKPIFDYIVDLVVRAVGKFFDAVPYEELINVPLPK